MSDIFFCESCDQYHDIDDGGPLQECMSDLTKDQQKTIYDAGYKWDYNLCYEALEGIIENLGLNDQDQEDYEAEQADRTREHESLE